MNCDKTQNFKLWQNSKFPNVNIVSKCQVPSSNGLGVMMSEDISTKELIFIYFCPTVSLSINQYFSLFILSLLYLYILQTVYLLHYIFVHLKPTKMCGPKKSFAYYFGQNCGIFGWSVVILVTFSNNLKTFFFFYNFFFKINPKY